MKLVDWDKVKISYDKQVSGTIIEPIYNIKVEAPIVKAIPIEWLKAKVKQHYDEGAYQTASAFQWIIDMWNEDEKDWEKENEKG